MTAVLWFIFPDPDPGLTQSAAVRRTWKGVLLLQISFNYGNFSDIIRSVEDSLWSPHTPSLASTVISWGPFSFHL